MGVWGIVLGASSFEIGEHWHTEDADVTGHMQKYVFIYFSMKLFAIALFKETDS